jgi:N-6 DNA Methylase
MAPTTEKSARLKLFVDWCDAHISGDEKGEAQIFLDRLFQAFGWPGLKEAGATCESRIKNDTGGTSFADLVWKPHVVIEMKKRGNDLAKHYAQAFAYWTRLVPSRPRYAILSNFDQFWIYDFEIQLDTPVDTISLKDLPEKFGALNFLFPGDAAPIFGNHQEAVTREAADKLATCFTSILERGVPRTDTQRFILQILVALFAEDIGLVEKYFVSQLLQDCKSPKDTFDLLGGLFEAMNAKAGTHGGRYKGIPYFNGGLFSAPAKVELAPAELKLLIEASQFDWSKVRPEIFGTIFEHSLGKEARHATGAHYTSPVDIMKIVGPTIVEPWTALIESADTLSRLKELLVRIEQFTVLDPACGSGNFLYVAYRALKRLEARIYERMASEYKSVDPSQRPFGFLTTRNFFGMDNNPFAIDIAKVTMMMAHKLSIDELHIQEPALPLDNLDSNFRAGDALITPTGLPTPWFKTDVIVGNPPFLGAKVVQQKLGRDYMRAVRAAYPEVPGMADFCVYWLRRAQNELSQCIPSDLVRGRAGLVGTQNIRNNKSRVGGLDYIVAGGTIVDAVDTQPWSGEANVHVSIVNWIKSQDPLVIPKSRRLWFKSASFKPAKKSKKLGSIPISKQYDLDARQTSFINSALSDAVDVSQALPLDCNSTPQRVFQGLTPGHKAFVLSKAKRDELIAAEPMADDLIRPYVVGKEILGEFKGPSRYLLDFGQRDLLAAHAYPMALRYVEDTVLVARRNAADKGKDAKGEMRPHHKQFLERWWQLSWGRGDLVAAISPLKRYIACSRVTSRPIFLFVDGSIRPGDALQVFAFEDDYSFGVLQSSVHVAWFMAKRSNMKSDPRYSSETVFDTFPWPQDPTPDAITRVAKASRELLEFRVEAAKKVPGGLRALYKTLDLPGKNQIRDLHQLLDAAVMSAYGFSSSAVVTQQLFNLNHSVRDRIAAGEKVHGPGVPPSFPDPKALLSSFSIR